MTGPQIFYFIPNLANTIFFSEPGLFVRVGEYRSEYAGKIQSNPTLEETHGKRKPLSR